MQPHPVAASVAVAPVLTGPPRTVTVVAATAGAIHLATGDAEYPALCLCRPGAVRLPHALVIGGPVAGGPVAGGPSAGGPVAGAGPAVRERTGSGQALGRWPSSTPTARSTAWAVGAAGRVGGGLLYLAPLAARVVRWWSPPRPGPVVAAPGAGRLADLVPDVLDPAGRAAARDLVDALRAPDADPAEPVRRLLGRGPGLTPLGDDVLAGALVTLRARRAPAAQRLTGALPARGLEARTTLVAAAILRHAARGECIPELAALITAVGGGPARVDLAWTALSRVGHTSGAGMAHGVLVALAATGLIAWPAAADPDAADRNAGADPTPTALAPAAAAIR